MSRYRIEPGDLAYAQEFLAAPVGYHSPGLQRLLNLMRGTGHAFKYVLITEERHKRWSLARLPAGRGTRPEPVPGVIYTDLLEAERDVFRRRWHDLTQGDPTLALPAH